MRQRSRCIYFLKVPSGSACALVGGLSRIVGFFGQRGDLLGPLKQCWHSQLSSLEWVRKAILSRLDDFSDRKLRRRVVHFKLIIVISA